MATKDLYSTEKEAHAQSHGSLEQEQQHGKPAVVGCVEGVLESRGEGLSSASVGSSCFVIGAGVELVLSQSSKIPSQGASLGMMSFTSVSIVDGFSSSFLSCCTCSSTFFLSQSPRLTHGLTRRFLGFADAGRDSSPSLLLLLDDDSRWSCRNLSF